MEKLLSFLDYFEPTSHEFNLVVPIGYKHEQQIDTFARNVRSKKPKKYCREPEEIMRSLYCHYEVADDATDGNFCRATTKLNPGDSYKIKLFKRKLFVDERLNYLREIEITVEDALNFLKKEGGVLVGLQGLTLACELLGEKLGVWSHIISPDERSTMLITNSTFGNKYYALPAIFVHGNSIKLSIMGYNMNLHTINHAFSLLCFIKI